MRRVRGRAIGAALAVGGWLLHGLPCSPPLLAAPAETFTIAQAVRPSAVVVLAPDAAPIEREAAEEFRRVVEIMTGAKLALATESAGPSIEIGSTASARARRIPDGGLARDGFVVRVERNRMFIAGAHPWGTAFGVAWVLERHGGVRWFFPGPLGEEIPRRNAWSLPLGEMREEPDFEVRDFACIGAARAEGAAARDAFRGWAWRNRVSMEGDSLNAWSGYPRRPDHAFWRWFPEGAGLEKHPQWVALTGEKRMLPSGWDRWQLCLSDTSLAAWVAARADSWFAANEDAPVFSLSPNDGGGWCRCERCLAVDDGDPEWLKRAHRFVTRAVERLRIPGISRDLGGNEYSRRVFRFAIDVAGRVAPRSTGRRVGTFAYDVYRRMPQGIAFPANLEIWYCQSAGSYFDRPVKEWSREALLEWAHGGVPLYVYEYYGHYRTRAPRLHPHAIADDLAYLHDAGVRGVHSEAVPDWALEGLNYYVAARCLWDATANVDSLIADWNRSLFGPAAPEMGAFFTALENAWNRGEPDGNWLDGGRLGRMMERFPPATMADLDRRLQRAREMAGQPLIRDRVDFFSHGLDYVRLYQEGKELGEALRADRRRTGIVRAGAEGQVTAIAPAMPALDDTVLLERARALRERERAMSEDPAMTHVFAWGALRDTEREYHGWLGAVAADYLAWKYWPAARHEASRPAVVSQRTYEEALATLKDRRSGGGATSSLARGVPVTASDGEGETPVDVLVNGRIEERGWRSREASWSDFPERRRATFKPREVEIRWDRDTAFDTVVLDWGMEEGVWWTSSDLRLEGEIAGRWQLLASVRGRGEEMATAVLLPPTRARSLRIVQAPEGGPPLRPNLLWLREVEVY